MELVNRKNSCSVKWDSIPEGVLPLWVADMDFLSPQPVIEAIMNRAKHGVYGYTYVPETYYEAISNWMGKRHNWQIEKDWILITPGVVPALNYIVQAFTKVGESVLIQQPVYNPFMNVIKNNNRTLVNSPLVNHGNHYEIDFVKLEQDIVRHDVKLIILCSPHNPVGRVWTEAELWKIGNLCLKYNVLIACDEIHHDLVYKGIKHIPLASLDKAFSEICITCTAPSKTFNLAGLHTANVIIENPEIREKLRRFMKKIGGQVTNIFGLTATESAYSSGEAWLTEVLEYLEENKNYVETFIRDNIPEIKTTRLEATYLMWLNCQALNLNNSELANFMVEKAKLWLNQGYVYGDEGAGFVRLNIGCHRSILEQALNQLKDAVSCLRGE